MQPSACRCPPRHDRGRTGAESEDQQARCHQRRGQEHHPGQEECDGRSGSDGKRAQEPAEIAQRIDDPMPAPRAVPVRKVAGAQEHADIGIQEAHAEDHGADREHRSCWPNITDSNRKKAPPIMAMEMHWRRLPLTSAWRAISSAPPMPAIHGNAEIRPTVMLLPPETDRTSVGSQPVAIEADLDQEEDRYQDPQVGAGERLAGGARLLAEACRSAGSTVVRYSRSASGSHFAVAGSSSMKYHHTAAQISGGRPSRKNIIRQSA